MDICGKAVQQMEQQVQRPWDRTVPGGAEWARRRAGGEGIMKWQEQIVQDLVGHSN